MHKEFIGDGITLESDINFKNRLALSSRYSPKDIRESVVLIQINGINELFKPDWPKYNDKQADCTGNRNGSYTKNHKHNKDTCTFDSGPKRNFIHHDSTTRF
ncbi:MAG: hypothetical protein HOP23_11745 [Methylococcaceae bacterium]|nr:hypothetical protein [Methylococcaceae bacterium]